jgi:hypothetical protein
MDKFDELVGHVVRLRRAGVCTDTEKIEYTWALREALEASDDAEVRNSLQHSLGSLDRGYRYAPLLGAAIAAYRHRARLRGPLTRACLWVTRRSSVPFLDDNLKTVMADTREADWYDIVKEDLPDSRILQDIPLLKTTWPETSIMKNKALTMLLLLSLVPSLKAENEEIAYHAAKLVVGVYNS